MMSSPRRCSIRRSATCELAGIEPLVVVHVGDPVACVLARNDQRRHMTKGQRAMAAWMTATSVDFPHPTTVDLAERADLDRSLVTYARTVAEHAPDLVDPVLSGARPLKDAYDEARARRSAASSEQARLDRLAESAPDLAAQVREDSLSLAEAEAASRQREQDRADRVARNVGYLRRVVEGYRLALDIDSMVDLDDAIAELNDDDRAHPSRLVRRTPIQADLDRRVARLTAAIDRMAA